MTPEVEALLARHAQTGDAVVVACAAVRDYPAKTGKARQVLINTFYEAEAAHDHSINALAQQLAREGDPDGAGMLYKHAHNMRAVNARYHRLRGHKDLRVSMQRQILDDEQRGHFDAA